MDQKLLRGPGLITLFLAVYGTCVWAVLAFAPALSLAATVPMTARLWLYDGAGYFWGMYLGASIVQIVLGARPLPYGRWDESRYHEPKTFLGQCLTLIAASLVGVFVANQALGYAIKHP